MTHVQKSRGKLIAVDSESQRDIDALRSNDIVRVKLDRARNGAHHRKAMALLDIVLNNTEIYADKTALLTDLKFKTGWVDTHISYRRDTRKFNLEYIETVVVVPKSISFSAMSQKAFGEFYEKMIDVILNEYLIGMDKEILENEVLSETNNWRG